MWNPCRVLPQGTASARWPYSTLWKAVTSEASEAARGTLANAAAEEEEEERDKCGVREKREREREKSAASAVGSLASAMAEESISLARSLLSLFFFPSFLTSRVDSVFTHRPTERASDRRNDCAIAIHSNAPSLPPSLPILQVASASASEWMLREGERLRGLRSVARALSRAVMVVLRKREPPACARGRHGLPPSRPPVRPSALLPQSEALPRRRRRRRRSSPLRVLVHRRSPAPLLCRAAEGARGLALGEFNPRAKGGGARGAPHLALGQDFFPFFFACSSSIPHLGVPRV